jgi:alpha-ketoglutarate-dependent taurine dioxygenase
MCDKRQAYHAISPSTKKLKNTCGNRDTLESSNGSSIHDNVRIHPVTEYQSLFNNTVRTYFSEI